MSGSAASEVRRATDAEWRRLGALLGEAFQLDPVWNWMCPDPIRRRRHLGPMFAQLIRPRVASGWAWTNDDLSGAAVWAAPKRWKTTSSEAVRLIPSLVRAVGVRGLPSRVGALTALEKLHPSEPHWYLEVVGADPARRGRGIGSSVLAPTLEQCDAEGLPAYLESSNEANLALYNRFGFEVLSEQHLAPGCPPLWPMWRDPR